MTLSKRYTTFRYQINIYGWMDGWMVEWMLHSLLHQGHCLGFVQSIHTSIHTFCIYKNKNVNIRNTTNTIWRMMKSKTKWRFTWFYYSDIHLLPRVWYLYSMYIHIYHDMMVILWWRSCIRSCRQTEEMWDLLLTHVKGGFICSNECVYILIYEFNTYGSLRRKTFDSRISYSMLHIFLLFYKVKRVSTKNFPISILLKNLIFLYLKLLRISKFTNRILFTYLALYSNPCY